jgi:N-acetylglucosaminyldiphosphoundecaprenol N-acetyl-beta-D-mannosaminyltransferase
VTSAPALDLRVGGPRNRPRLGFLPVDLVTRGQALDRIGELVRAGRGGTVFTPNVDHVLLADEDPRFRAAYEAASLSVVDGMPVVWALRLAGHRVPEKVSGSDLVRPLAERAADEGWRVFFLGGKPGVAQQAASRLRAERPSLEVVGAESPTVDMDGPVEARRALHELVRSARPDVVLVALGSPKGELWAHEARDELRPAVIVGIGAGLDFIVGTARRAPPWMSNAGLEWLYRLVHEPRRLWRRYLVRGPRFLRHLVAAWLSRSDA